MTKRHLKIFIFTVFLTLMANSLFAVEEYISNIYKKLDHVFIIKSEKELDTILTDNNQDRYYYLIENYTEKKIRRLIVNNDYDFAMTAIVIVIEHNLENENAVEMYSIIADAYDTQRKYETELENKRLLEIARVQNEKEKQRGSVEKEYVSAVNATSGKSVYVSGKETKLTSANWKASLGLVDLTNLYDDYSSLSTFHYGIAIDYRYEYTIDKKMVIGADAFGGFQFLALADEESMVPLLGNAELLGKIAFPTFSKDFFIRLGLGTILSGKTETAIKTKNVIDTMFTPILGIKMERINLGFAKLDLGADWYAGHLFYQDIKAAAGGTANLEFPFAEIDTVKLNLNVGVRDIFLMKNNGIENRASIILAIGAENVIR